MTCKTDIKLTQDEANDDFTSRGPGTVCWNVFTSQLLGAGQVWRD